MTAVTYPAGATFDPPAARDIRAFSAVDGGGSN